MKTDDLTLITRAMRKAQQTGVNPYDSHPTQSREWEAKWKRRERYRAERQAKLESRWIFINC